MINENELEVIKKNTEEVINDLNSFKREVHTDLSNLRRDSSIDSQLIKQDVVLINERYIYLNEKLFKLENHYDSLLALLRLTRDENTEQYKSLYSLILKGMGAVAMAFMGAILVLVLNM